MNKWIEKLFGIDKIKAETVSRLAEAEEATKLAKQSLDALDLAKEAEEQAKLTPKDRATKKKEPWVGVLETHVNKDNIRNGFFELDWNEYFVLKLRQEGYGFDGDP